MREWINLVEDEAGDDSAYEHERKVEQFFRDLCEQIGFDLSYSKRSVSYDSSQNIVTIFCGDAVSLEQVEALKAHGTGIRIDMNHRNTFGVQIELSPNIEL